MLKLGTHAWRYVFCLLPHHLRAVLESRCRPSSAVLEGTEHDTRGLGRGSVCTYISVVAVKRQRENLGSGLLRLDGACGVLLVCTIPDTMWQRLNF